MLPPELKATLHHRTVCKPRAFTSDWVLAAATQLDACSPHFLLHLLSASDQKRQTIFLTFAELQRCNVTQIARKLPDHPSTDWERPDDPLVRIARALVASKPREIIRCVFGDCPDGLF